MPARIFTAGGFTRFPLLAEFARLALVGRRFQLTLPPNNAYIVGMAELLGTFEQIVLLAVLDLGDNAYGRSVFFTVRKSLQHERNVTAGAVYTTLDRVEAKGLLSSRLEMGAEARAGRPRRFYRLTSLGASSLTEVRNTLESMWQGKNWPLEV